MVGMYQELRSFTHRCILFGYYESYELQFQTVGMSDLRLNGRCVEHYTLVLYKFKRKDSTHGAVNIKSPEGSLGLFVLGLGTGKYSTSRSLTRGLELGVIPNLTPLAPGWKQR